MNTAEDIATDVAALEQDATIHLPLGLLGFEHMKDYRLTTDPTAQPFRWLEVIGNSSLAFLVISPFEVVPGYSPRLSDQDAEFIGLAQPSDALLLNIVTLRPNGRATVNLKGPVVLNRHTLRGKQVVISNAAEYSLQHPLPTAETC